MTNAWHDYRGFKITTNETFEDMRDRIARGVTEPVVTGYYFYVWRRVRDDEAFRRLRKLTSLDYPTESEAIIKAQEAIDELLNKTVEKDE